MVTVTRRTMKQLGFDDVQIDAAAKPDGYRERGIVYKVIKEEYDDGKRTS